MITGMIDLKEAARLLSEAGLPSDDQTILRWIKKGLGPRTNRVQLRATKLGKWFTKIEWIEEFIDRRTAVAIPEPDPVLVAAESARRCEEAMEWLAKRRGSRWRRTKKATA